MPLGAPLLLSTDAWTYWDYGRIAAVHDANPYAATPSDFPDDPAFRVRRHGLARHDDGLRPAFTLASEPLARAAGTSADAAAWIYKSLAAVAVLACGGARRAALAPAARSRSRSSAGTRCSPCTSRGGGHNDAWVALLVLARARGGAPRAGGSSPASAGRSALFVKWVPLVLLPLRALEARATRPPRRAPRLRASPRSSSAPLAFARYGTAWLHAFGPLARNANHETRWALPHRLEQLGVPHGVSIALFAARVRSSRTRGCVREAWRGRARLGLATCALLLAAPYLVVWYVVWAVPLAAAEDDEPAALLSLALCAYLLRQTIPL